MSQSFDGYAFLISGGAKGLGRAIAAGLSESGAIVGIADIDGVALQETAGEIRRSGGNIHAFETDVGCRESYLAAAAAFAEAAGGLDGVINNASWLVYEPVDDVTDETLERMTSAGFKSVIWGTQILLRHRKQGRSASIINFSSPVVYHGRPNTSIYSAIKATSASLTRSLAAELGPQGIRVNAVAPGSVPTPGALKYVTSEEYERRAATIPMRKLGSEADVLHAIRFLLSEDAAFINGAMLAVDGGIIAAA
ncbi:SDR family NAD(P)-dependent oxidoreductase [Tsuneonella sp. HG222]